jgi:hypothetical protein
MAKDFFAKTAGCFAGTPLVSEEQGDYEARDISARAAKIFISRNAEKTLIKSKESQ